jgi:hypothetical protein
VLPFFSKGKRKVFETTVVRITKKAGNCACGQQKPAIVVSGVVDVWQ